MFTDLAPHPPAVVPAAAPAGIRFAPRRATATAPALPAEAVRLRHFAAAWLARWNLTDDDRDAALLIAGELLANAAEHGRSEMTLSLCLSPRLLHISVADHGHGRAPAEARRPPVLPADEEDGLPAGLDESGRGLAIIAALAAWVEVVHDDSGCQVWAALGVATRATPGLRAVSRSGT